MAKTARTFRKEADLHRWVAKQYDRDTDGAEAALARAAASDRSAELAEKAKRKGGR